MDHLRHTESQRHGAHFREEMEAAAARPERVADLVRRAYGEGLLGLADEPAGGPEAAGVQADARAAVLREGWLTEDELRTLPVAEAEPLALRRFAERPDEAE